jgi:hypothetical protein
MNDTEIDTVLSRLIDIRPPGAPEQHSPRHIAIRDEWVRILRSKNCEPGMLGNALVDTCERWPTTATVSTIAQSMSRPAETKRCLYCGDLQGWTPGVPLKKDIAGLGGTYEFVYDTYRPCPSCRPDQYEAWRNRRDTTTTTKEQS